MLTPEEAGVVSIVCHEWGLATAPIRAIIDAEGGSSATLLRAVQFTYPEVKRFDKAVDIICRSYVHAMSDVAVLDATIRERVVKTMKARWAPDGVDNDPRNLNAFWARNVLSRWVAYDPPKDVKDVRA